MTIALAVGSWISTHEVDAGGLDGGNLVGSQDMMHELKH